MTRIRARRFAGLVALTLVAVAAPACGGSSSGGSSGPSGTTLSVLRTESIDGWVLDSAAAYATYQTQAAVLEGLLRTAPDGSGVVAGLSDKWSYDPATTSWTFRIRKGAAFSDGSPVTGKDVMFSSDLWRNGPNFGGSYARVEAVSSPKVDTVVFKLTEPDNNFEALISASVSGVLPAKFGGRTEKAYYQDPIGAGAYKVDDWSASGRLSLSRNPHFYDRTPTGPDKIEVDVVGDDNERSVLFEAGDADVVEYIPASSRTQFDKDRLLTLPVSQVSHLSLNLAEGPLADVKVRRAIASALDYQGMIDGAFAGEAEPAAGILPPNLPRYTPPTKDYFSTDLASARKALAASSGAGGFKSELIYDAAVGSDALAAQVVAANLAKLDIKVKLTGLETAAFLDRAFGGDAPMTLWSFGAVSPDIIDPVNWIAGTGWLFSGFDTAALAEKAGAYSTSSDDASAKAVIAQIQDDAITNVPAIALAHFSVAHAVASSVKIKATPWGLYYYDDVSMGG